MLGTTHKTRLITIVILLVMCTLTTAHAEFIVQTIYFQPTNAPSFNSVKDNINSIMLDTQRIYADELERHGFGRKTFRLEMENNNVKIHHISGKSNVSAYESDTWRSVTAELPNHLNPYVHSIDKLDRVRVIIVGIPLINKTYAGLGGSQTNGNYFGGNCIIAQASPQYGIELIFHEIGHCFSLFHQGKDIHNELVLNNRLELLKYEARWLDKHYHFNNNQKSGSRPIISDIPTTNVNNNILEFTINARSDTGLHQAVIARKASLEVLDYVYLNGENEFDLPFEVENILLNNRIGVMVIDVQGNYREINMELDIKPAGIIEESVADNVVYLTLIQGEERIPNEFGLKPSNDDQTEWRQGYAHERLTDNKTNNGYDIIIRGTKFERGICLSPDHNGSIIRYNLQGANYVSFDGFIGMTDDRLDRIGKTPNSGCNVGGTSRIIFEIDNNVIYTSNTKLMERLLHKIFLYVIMIL